MNIWIWLSIVIYSIGFILTFLFNMALGMITLGLTLFRSAVWPIYWLTGWPSGSPLMMD